MYRICKYVCICFHILFCNFTPNCIFYMITMFCMLFIGYVLTKFACTLEIYYHSKFQDPPLCGTLHVLSHKFVLSVMLVVLMVGSQTAQRCSDFWHDGVCNTFHGNPSVGSEFIWEEIHRYTDRHTAQKHGDIVALYFILHKKRILKLRKMCYKSIHL